ncbi:MAG: hypothetical protein WD059_13750 [Balneolaceae bacterium]
MSDPKVYSRSDISKILSKASEIQTRKDLYSDQQGLNKAELLHIAEEVGIDKDVLIQALREF